MKKDLKNAIVKFEGGFYRVSSHRACKVNLAGVWGGKIRFKAIPEAAVVEAYDEFYDNWTQSETYRDLYAQIAQIRIVAKKISEH